MSRVLQRSADRANPLRRWSLLALISVMAVGTFGVLATLHAGSSRGWTAFDDIEEALVAALATVACVIRARKERAVRASAVGVQRRAWVAWSLIAFGVGAWATGQIGWSVLEVGLGSTVHSPSPLDAAFLTFPVFVVVGLLAMVQTPAGSLSQLRGAAEGLLIASGFFLFSWSVVIGSVVAHSSTSAFGQAVSLAYPALDAVALAALLFMGLRRRTNPPPGLALLALGVVCVAASDSAFWYLHAVQARFPGVSGLDTGWVAGFMLIALAAFQPGEQHPHSQPGERHTRWETLGGSRLLLVLPSLPAAIGVLTVSTRWLLGDNLGSLGPLLAIMTVVATFGVLTQVIVTYENRALTRDLERRVRERTAELHATERHYRALVQHSSDVMMVVDPDLTIRYVSASVTDIFGRAPETLVGQDLSIFGEVGGQTLAEALERAGLAPGQVVRAEWELSDGTGRTRHAESTITNLLSEPHVRAFVLNTRDVTDRVALADQLRHQAFHDPLTGLSNRALLGDRAAQAFARSLRTGAQVAVITLDLDGFKLVNNSLGHQTGDKLLRGVAQRLESAARPEDTVARYGGDQFVLLIDAVEGAEEALELAERLCDALRPQLTLAAGGEYAVTASFGVAVGSASDTDFEQLLSDADLAMYAVKAGGKNAAGLFQPRMHEQAREQFNLQADLRKAVELGEFWLLYQPQFELKGEQLMGLEALVRWDHPKQGLIRPDRFMSLAEETGLIVPLGRWVLDQALQDVAEWDRLAARTPPLSVAVNVSPVQLKAPGLLADVQKALERSEVAPWRVVLEITERSLVEDSHGITDVLRGLKELGVRIAIDDFGTGYASLAYLRRMPVDILKIDRTFMATSGEGQRGRELLEAIISIGQTLSLEMVAEGIETPDQLAMAKDIGCDLAQGYLLGQPLPVAETQHLIARGETQISSMDHSPVGPQLEGAAKPQAAQSRPRA